MASWAVHTGDAAEGVRTLAAGSVRCCVTSPPYYGLRDYGTATWNGGDPECDHLRPAAHGYDPFATSTLGPKRDGVSATNSAHSDSTKRQQFKSVCTKCGAIRADRQVGLEATPAAYVARMVDVFREVRRALADDGTIFVNIGDSYSAAGWECRRVNSVGNGSMDPAERRSGKVAPDGVKNKDLLGVPWMLAFALRADGWYLRSDIIWAKPNPMPESVTDRPTKAHEYLFLLSKSERYFYNADAVAEPAAESTYARLDQDVDSQAGSTRANGGAKTNGPMKAVRKGGGASFGKQNHDAAGTGQQSRTYERPVYLTRNRRSVWWIPTESYHGAHFAVMPSKLVEPCILAGSEPGDLVLDPFAGSGTTLAVAAKHGRRAFGVELNPAYVGLIGKRMGNVVRDMFAAVG